MPRLAKTHEDQECVNIISIVFYYVGIVLEEVILGGLPSRCTVGLLLSPRVL